MTHRSDGAVFSLTPTLFPKGQGTAFFHYVPNFCKLDVNPYGRMA